MLMALVFLLTIQFDEQRQSYSEFKSDSISSYAQISESYTDLVYDERISSAQLHKEGWPLSFPVIVLNSGEKLEMGFDLLSGDLETFYYTFVHCDKDWNSSDLSPFEYLDGFPENDIQDVTASFNTTFSYYHYSLIFPNERISFRISGNYILNIYKETIDDPVITQRFIVTEDIVPITTDIHLPLMTLGDGSGQQIDFKINISGKSIIDPDRNIYSAIMRNGNWTTMKNNLKADIVTDREISYNSLSGNNIFEGGNEFRTFDIRDIHYNGENVKNIEYIPPYYHMYLYESSSRGSKPYFIEPDFNGRYFVATDNDRARADLEADYVWVHFSLPHINPQYGSNVYIFGAISDWKVQNRYIMQYDADKAMYKASLLLKQGWYNYKYILVSSSGDIDQYIFEGNHYETENEYLILVYYRNPRERFDRIIGHTVISSWQ